MGWRTIVVANRAKLDLKYGSLVVRKADEIMKIHIPEIAMLIIETTAVSITSALLCELIEKKVSVVFCDKSRNPISELVPHHGSHDSTLKIREQINWNNDIKGEIWKEIIKQKIEKQSELLEKYNIETFKLLNKYLDEIEVYDMTNREAHAAKVYFNSIFGNDFSREHENTINSALNYGYQILLSLFNREIYSNGYLTQMGIFHKNRFNHYNLGSDLMEPFRPIVDEIVLLNNFENFGTEEKRIMQTLNEKTVFLDEKEYYLVNGIQIYVKSVIEALNECDITRIKDYRNER